MDEYGGDIRVVDLDLLADDGLETAVYISLFSNARALPDQMPPGQEGDDLQGYWADIQLDEGDQTGSLLWLLAREKTTNTALTNAAQWAREALDWMIEDRVATRVEVNTELITRGIMAIEVQIFRPQEKTASYRYYFEWETQIAKRVA